MLFQLRSEFEIDLERIDKRHQPGKQLLVNRMVVVGVEGCTVSEFHHAAKLVSLRTRRYIDPDEGFNEPGDLSPKGANLLNDVLLLILGDVRLPAEGKCVDDHAPSVYSNP